MTREISFLGRSGVKLIKGLRVAYLSGIDFDIIGGYSQIIKDSSKDKYLGNYFNEEDLNKILEDYEVIVKNDPTQREGIDLFITG